MLDTGKNGWEAFPKRSTLVFTFPERWRELLWNWFLIESIRFPEEIHSERFLYIEWPQSEHQRPWSDSTRTMPVFSSLSAATRYHNAALRRAPLSSLRNAACAYNVAVGGSSAFTYPSAFSCKNENDRHGHARLMQLSPAIVPPPVPGPDILVAQYQSPIAWHIRAPCTEHVQVPRRS